MDPSQQDFWASRRWMLVVIHSISIIRISCYSKAVIFFFLESPAIPETRTAWDKGDGEQLHTLWYLRGWWKTAGRHSQTPCCLHLPLHIRGPWNPILHKPRGSWAKCTESIQQRDRELCEGCRYNLTLLVLWAPSFWQQGSPWGPIKQKWLKQVIFLRVMEKHGLCKAQG